MPQSFTSNYLHIVFSTKGRRPLLDEEIRPRVWAYLGGIARNVGAEATEVGGMSDHVHILVRLPADLSAAKIVNLLKSNSSKWLHEQGRMFRWQQGYGAFSVSASNAAAVKRYIREQEKHHRRRDFTEEFRTLLQKHRIAFDEKYLLD